jgi:CRP-like cAMP-binding protein
MAAHINQSTVRNRLLAALPPLDFERLQSKLTPVQLPLNDVLLTPGSPIGAAHFVESGIVSIVALLDDGDMVEVGLVGRDGLVSAHSW